MLYVRKLFTQDLRDGKQIAFPKEPSSMFFAFDYSSHEPDRIISFIFKAPFGEFEQFEGKNIMSRLYAAGSESRMDGEVKAFIRDELNAQVNDLLIFKNIGTKHADFEVMFVTQANPVYPLLLKLTNGDNHSVVSLDERKTDDTELEQSLQQIYYGAPGTGKSHTIKKLTAGKSVIRTTFHPDSDYSTFVGAYKPTTREVELRDVSGHKIVENSSVVREERIVYEFVAQAFLQAYANAWKLYAENPIEPAKQYLVIEEINRGNCAQIFGDLFQLLDRNDYGFSDYPIAADSDLGKYLKKELAGLILSNADSINSMYNGRDVVSEILNGKILLLPNNLYIWATMNTSDQSLFPIDSAFKRRWEWKYIPIDTEKEKWSISVNGKSYSWSSFLKQINNEIDDTTHSEDKKLGFYFCKATDGVISAEKFVSKVLFYLYNDVFKDYGFSREFFKDANGKTIPFQMFFNCSDGSTNEYATETILKNLKVDLMENTVAGGSADDLLDAPEEDMLDDDGNKPTSTSRDYSKYSINHDGRFDKRSLVRNTIFTFIKQHAELPDDEIISKWKSLNVFNKFILTESEYNRELNSSSDRSGRQSRFFDFELPQNHSHMYVYNQFNVERIEVFISRVNAQDWGIHLEKIE